jgi:nitrate/TMAO reductase-like tetraheme cytochrome c subunit
MTYFRSKHEDISQNTFMRKSVRSVLNCGACHAYAEFGSFEDAHIRIPE